MVPLGYAYMETNGNMRNRDHSDRVYFRGYYQSGISFTCVGLQYSPIECTWSNLFAFFCNLVFLISTCDYVG